MSNELQTSSEFQERLFTKIRDSIGELMTEKELKALVETTMQKLFFTPVEIKASSYNNYHSSTGPAPILGLVKELLQPSLIEALKQWLAEHPEEVKAALDKTLGTGMEQAMAGAFRSMLSGTFASLQMNLQSTLQQAIAGRPNY